MYQLTGLTASCDLNKTKNLLERQMVYKGRPQIICLCKNAQPQQAKI